MLVKVKTLQGYKLHSLDGEIGSIKEFYFDDHHWTIRYLVAETGNWLADRQVLISPHALVAVNKAEQFIAVNLTKDQIENSPSLDSDKPVSRRFEEVYHGYYKMPLYWNGPFMWGATPNLVADQKLMEKTYKDKKASNQYLRSTQDVSGHNIHATDGDIGRVDDFILDDEAWAIRYFVIDTKNWLTGRKVLISPKWIERISWIESKVFLNLTKESIKSSPEYTEEALLTRDYESGLYHHYNRQGYWVHDTGKK